MYGVWIFLSYVCVFIAITVSGLRFLVATFHILLLALIQSLIQLILHQNNHLAPSWIQYSIIPGRIKLEICTLTIYIIPILTIHRYTHTDTTLTSLVIIVSLFILYLSLSLFLSSPKLKDTDIMLIYLAILTL